MVHGKRRGTIKRTAAAAAPPLGRLLTCQVKDIKSNYGAQSNNGRGGRRRLVAALHHDGRSVNGRACAAVVVGGCEDGGGGGYVFL